MKLSFFFLLFSLTTSAGVRRPFMLCLVETIEVYRDSRGIHLSDSLRASINRKYGNADISDELSNKNFMDLKDGELKIEAQRYFDVENSVLKELNDAVVEDKELVTALTNKYKLLIRDEITQDPFLSKHLLAVYSDFKSVRMAFGNKADPMDVVEFQQRIRQAYRRANMKFAHFADSNNIGILPSIKGAASNPQAWHMAGIWDTADKASLAGRESRRAKLTSQTFTDGFYVEEKFKADLAKLEKLRSKIVAGLQNNHNGLLESHPDGGITLSREAAELIRKIKAPASANEAFVGALKKRLSDRFELNLSAEQAQLIANYYRQADIFSPAIYTAKRTIIPFDQATEGALSVDLKGLGAENAFQTLSALTQTVGEDVSTVLAATRRGEVLATENLNTRGKIFDQAIESFESRRKVPLDAKKQIHATGDDKVHMPSKKISEQEFSDFLSKDLENAVESNKDLSGYRIVYSEQLGTSEGLDLRFISNGEDFEKSCRLAVENVDKNLFRKLENSYLSLYHRQNGEYKVFLRKESFTKAEREVLKKVISEKGQQSATITIKEILFI